MNILGLCQCEYCREAWKNEYHQPLDEQEIQNHPHWWDTFFQRCWNRAMQKAFDACRKHKPEIEFAFYLRRIAPQEAKQAESICGMDNYEVNLTEVYEQAGIFAHGLRARYCRNLNAPTTLMINAFYNCWGEATVKHPNLLATEIAAVRANGVKASLAEYLRSWGQAEPHAFDSLTKAFQVEEPLVQYTGKTWRSQKHIALLDNGRLHQSEYTVGAHKILVESHQQFDIIDETALGNLSGDKLLWVSPIQLWEPRRWEQVLDWVERGGILMAEMGTYMEEQSPASAIPQAVGVTKASRPPFSAAYCLPEGRLTDPICGNFPLLLHEPTWAFDGEGWERLMDVCDPIAEWSPPEIVFRTNVLHPRVESRRAGIVQGRFGKGKIILLPGSVSQAYFCHNYAPLRRLMAKLLSDVCPNPYEVQGPCTLEANLLENDHARALHLVTYCINVAGGEDTNHDESGHKELWASARFSDIETITPLYNITVGVDEKLVPNGIRLHPDNELLSCEKRDGKVYCVIPRLDLHAVLELY
jgi:hypothetical protein